MLTLHVGGLRRIDGVCNMKINKEGDNNMETKYFLHRIQEENGSVSKGIEVHDTLDSAILSYWGRMKLAFNANPNIHYVSCKITDTNGAVIAPYKFTWKGNTSLFKDKYFMHYIRLDGETFTKNIDVCDSFNQAIASYAAQMEYGYNNPNHPNVSFVSCLVEDQYGAIMTPYNGTWKLPEPEPEPEPEE